MAKEQLDVYAENASESAAQEKKQALSVPEKKAKLLVAEK